MDWPVLHALNDFLAGHDALEDPVVAYVNAGQALFLLLVVGLFVLVRVSRVAVRRGTVAAVTSAGGALLAAQVVSRLVERPRPFVSDPGGVHLFSGHVADPGFPSDHATASFAIAVAILLRSRRWGLVVLAMATVLSIGRVAMGVHYPTDVIGGATLGSAVALLLWIPPLRRATDVLADRIGGLWDAGVGRLSSLIGGAGRP